MFHGILIQQTSPLNLQTFVDTDWAANTDARVSTTAFITFLDSNPISWSACKQRAVSRSSTKAEFHALVAATSETVWLHSLITELGLHLPNPPQIFCDNIGATHFSLNPVQHIRMKHIEIDLLFVCDLVQKGRITVSHVHTLDQLANLLTKALPCHRFQTLRSKIGVTDGTSILRGHIRKVITLPQITHPTASVPPQNPHLSKSNLYV
jgi:hypothetical protein